MPAFTLSADLIATDLLLKQWANATRDDHLGRRENPLSRVMREGPGAGQPGHAPQLADELLEIDRIIARLPERTRVLVSAWYRSSTPTSEIAKRIGMSRATMYRKWKVALLHIRDTLRQTFAETSRVPMCSGHMPPRQNSASSSSRLSVLE